MLYGRAFGFPGAAPIHRFNVGMILKKSHLTFLTPPRSLPLRPPTAHIQILNSHFSGNGVAEVLKRRIVEAEGRWSGGTLKPGSRIAEAKDRWSEGSLKRRIVEAGFTIRQDDKPGFAPGSRVHVSGPTEHGSVEPGIHPGTEKSTGGAFQGGWWNQNWKYARGWMVIVVEA